jgi:hypothetical protein
MGFSWPAHLLENTIEFSLEIIIQKIILINPAGHRGDNEIHPYSRNQIERTKKIIFEKKSSETSQVG